MEAYIGQITLFAGNFAPRGWAFCQGQILSIAQNTALFSILGVTYGGNGQTTFALPDLRSRVPVQQGQGPGLPAIVLGEVAGTPTVTLNTTQMPAHNHTFQGQQGTSSNNGNDSLPGGQLPGVPVVNIGGTDYNVNSYVSGATADGSFAGLSGTIGVSGNNQPFSIMQPFLGLNFIICMEGIFPPRN